MNVLRLLKRPRVPNFLRRSDSRKPRPAILMYHRIADLVHDPWLLAVSPRNFQQQISYIRKHRTPMLVDEMVRRLGEGTLPADAIAVTFDDGYRDNLVHAKPVLAHYGVPGTVFLATGFVGREHPYWWDELAVMVLEAKHFATSTVQIGAGEIPIAWGEMEADDLSPDWQAWEEPRTARQRSYLELWRRLRFLEENERDAVMESLRTQFEPLVDGMSLPMNAQEIAELVTGPTMTLGAHTVTHPVLTQIQKEHRRTEIQDSMECCRCYLNRAVTGFAYPYGEVDVETREIAADSGLSWACSTETRFLDEVPLDLFRLPRVGVYNAPLPVFIGLTTS